MRRMSFREISATLLPPKRRSSPVPAFTVKLKTAPVFSSNRMSSTAPTTSPSRSFTVSPFLIEGRVGSALPTSATAESAGQRKDWGGIA